jgi:nitrogen regulatory protein PII
MKLLTAMIRPEQLPAVKKALFDAQFKHFTASTAVGTGSRSEQEMYRGQQREISLFDRVRVELALNDASVEPAIEAIAAGCMDSGGYGRILVTELHDAMTVWSGERGPRSLQT